MAASGRPAPSGQLGDGPGVALVDAAYAHDYDRSDQRRATAERLGRHRQRRRRGAARIVHDLVDQTDYPSRDFTLADPDGNHGEFATFAG
jgi:hypothetical protein